MGLMEVVAQEISPTAAAGEESDFWEQTSGPHGFGVIVLSHAAVVILDLRTQFGR